MEQPLLLDRQNVEAYFDQTTLRSLPAGTEIMGIDEVTENTFVNWVFALHVRLGDSDNEETFYVRQSRDYVKEYKDLPRDPGRVDTEAKALAFINKVAQGTVPRVVSIDRANNVLVLTDVRLGGELFADELAAGRIHQDAGSQFGNTIGQVQKTTFGKSLGEILGDNSKTEGNDKNAYLGSRVQAPMTLFPEQTQRLLDDSVKATRCFVIGDLSPKNIFVEGSNIRFLDLERTSTGDPAYDPAYVITHLLIDVERNLYDKSIEFITGFMESYLSEVADKLGSQELDELQNRIVRFVGFSILHRTQASHFVSYTGEDKEDWQQKAGLLLSDTKSTSVVEAIKKIIS